MKDSVRGAGNLVQLLSFVPQVFEFCIGVGAGQKSFDWNRLGRFKDGGIGAGDLSGDVLR